MRHLVYYTPPWRWRPSFCFPYVINFSSFIKVKPLAHKERGKSLVTECVEYQPEKRFLVERRWVEHIERKTSLCLILSIFLSPSFVNLSVYVCVWLTRRKLCQAGTWLWLFHLVWLSRSLLVRPLLPFSLSCPLLQLANQPNHCPPLLLPSPSLLGPRP